MKSIYRFFIMFIVVISLQSCAVYAGYAIYKTVSDINNTLAVVNNSITTIRNVLNEGKNLKRAAEDGRLITTLAEEIPSLIQSKVEQAVREKINTLAGNMKTFSQNFTEHALNENLTGATKSYNNMVNTYNRFNGLMDDLYESSKPPL